MHEALYYSPESEGKVRCLLCPHECLISNGKSGICRVRENREGKLYSLVYGQIVAIHSDPVEKKPLYHFYPGRQILSVGTAGCNLRCSFCQNYSLSQSKPAISRDSTGISPGELVQKAAALTGNLGLAYTYNEPTVFYEWIIDAARKAKAAGLKNCMVSNGYINPLPLNELLPTIDAFNIDLKSFSDDFYIRMTGGRLSPVLESLKAIVHAGKHLEITLLVIPSLNDSEDEFRRMVNWICRELGPRVPLHLSRYFPAWKISLPPTPLETLHNFARIAGEKLHFVYTGNVGANEHSSTFCPECKSLVISRKNYNIELPGVTGEGKCAYCHATLAGCF